MGIITEIVDGDGFSFSVGFVETKGKSGGSWFVDDTFNFQSSDLTSILGSLSLRVIEISRYSNDSTIGKSIE